MEEIGVPPHIVGSVLNHSRKGFKGVTSVYTRGELIYPRRKALASWSRLLVCILDGHSLPIVEKILYPDTELEAAKSDRFKVAIQSEEASWLSFLADTAASEETRHASSNP